MNDSCVTEEAVEAAAKAAWGDSNPATFDTWDTEPDVFKNRYKRVARASLEAAMPHVRGTLAQEIKATREANVQWVAYANGMTHALYIVIGQQ